MKYLFTVLFFIGIYHPLFSQQVNHKYCATLCNSQADSMTTDEIISCNRLMISDSDFHIVNYFIRTSVDTVTAFYGVDSEFSNPGIESRILSLKKGDKINFDIKLVDKKGRQGRKCSLSLIIK